MRGKATIDSFGKAGVQGLPENARAALRVLLSGEVFSDQELDELSSRCHIRTNGTGEVIIREGEESDNRVYLIIKGSVSISIKGRFILRLQKPGDTIGEMGLISSAPRSATVTTDMDSTFLVVDAMESGQDEDPPGYKFRYYFSRLFNSILTEKLRRTSDRARLYEDMVSHSREVERKSESLQEEITSYLREISMYTHLVNSAGDAIIVTDTQGKVLTVNPALLKLYGGNSEDVTGMDFVEMISLDNGGDCNWREITGRAKDEDWTGEIFLRTGDGELMPVDCRVSSITGDNNDRLAFSVIIRDIRLRKAHEEKIKKQSQELEEAYRAIQNMERAKNGFLTLVSHELRTPITSIMAFAETLGMEGMVDPEDQPDFIRTIYKEAEKLSDMVSKVLALSKLESDQMYFEFAKCDVETLAAEQIGVFTLKAKEKGLDMHLENLGAPTPIVVDKEQIAVALSQVLDNAVKYTDKGSITASVSQNEQETIFRVSDTGRGIQNDDYQVLLEKFSRGDVKESRIHGLGLGLPLCYLIVKAHSGNMRFEKNDSGGTVVSIVLPLQHPVKNNPDIRQVT
ncbi:MAG: ATP-binding protein [Deltaproteobacteria bacterium]|nr:ATP-binding protein [Deltaproteobacteria bacterium]